jgi:Phosphotransferase enzyme family
MAAPERLPESERNVLLRRVDWRFLLQQDRPPVTFCSAPRLTRAVRLMTSSEATAGRGQHDLAVIHAPTSRSLRAAAAALRPGGEIYLEQRVPRVRGHTRLRARLESAGLEDVRLYWSWPPPDRGRAQFWLPLDAPDAIEFFLRSRPRRGVHRLLRSLWRLGTRLGLTAPLAAIARTPGGAPREDVERVLRDSWASWGFGTPPARFSWLLLTGGRRSINKVVGLVFAGREQKPHLAVKFARSVSEEAPLRREAETLRMLERDRPGLEGVPRVLFLERRCGRLALGESAVQGQPMLERLSHESFPELAAQVTSWLVELAGAKPARPAALWWSRLVEEPLREFEQTFGEGRGAELGRARSLLSRLDELPLVCEHRDCSPWNILVTDQGGLAVLDWESSEPSGLPALDLLYFLTHAAFLLEGALDSGHVREAYARMLDPTTSTGSVVRRCEESYCERLGLDWSAIRPLRLLCWIVHSSSEYRHLKLETAAAPERTALHSSLFFSLWEEELRKA